MDDNDILFHPASQALSSSVPQHASLVEESSLPSSPLEDGSVVIEQSWHWVFIILAYVTAFIGSYAAIRLLEHGLWRSERERQNATSIFTKYPRFSTAFVLGTCTIWSMHFIGMQAVKLKLPEDEGTCYDWGQTFASLLLAIAGVWMGIELASRDIFGGADRVLKLKELLQDDPLVTSKGDRHKTNRRIHMMALFARLHWIALGSVFVALGALSMHYLGMVAMQGPFRREFSVGWVASSVLVGVVVAFAGLWILYRPLHWKVEKWWYRYCSAMVIAGAVCSLHFLGMHSVTYIADDTQQYKPNSPGCEAVGGWKPDQLIVVFVGIAVPFIAFYVEHTISNELRMTYHQLLDIRLTDSTFFQVDGTNSRGVPSSAGSVSVFSYTGSQGSRRSSGGRRLRPARRSRIQVSGIDITNHDMRGGRASAPPSSRKRQVWDLIGKSFRRTKKQEFEVIKDQIKSVLDLEEGGGGNAVRVLSTRKARNGSSQEVPLWGISTSIEEEPSTDIEEEPSTQELTNSRTLDIIEESTSSIREEDGKMGQSIKQSTPSFDETEALEEAPPVHKSASAGMLWSDSNSEQVPAEGKTRTTNIGLFECQTPTSTYALDPLQMMGDEGSSTMSMGLDQLQKNLTEASLTLNGSGTTCPDGSKEMGSKEMSSNNQRKRRSNRSGSCNPDSSELGVKHNSRRRRSNRSGTSFPDCNEKNVKDRRRRSNRSGASFPDNSEKSGKGRRRRSNRSVTFFPDNSEKSGRERSHSPKAKILKEFNRSTPSLKDLFDDSSSSMSLGGSLQSIGNGIDSSGTIGFECDNEKTGKESEWKSKPEILLKEFNPDTSSIKDLFLSDSSSSMSLENEQVDKKDVLIEFTHQSSSPVKVFSDVSWIDLLDMSSLDSDSENNSAESSSGGEEDCEPRVVWSLHRRRTISNPSCLKQQRGPAIKRSETR